MLRYMIPLVFLLAVCTGVSTCAADPVIGVPIVHGSIDLARLSRPKNLSANYAPLFATGYGKPAVLRSSNDVSATVAERERKYTWYWLHIAVSPWLAPYDVMGSMNMARRVKGKDEVTFLSYTLPIESPRTQGSVDVEVIDGRVLTLVLECRGIAQLSIDKIVASYLSVPEGATVVVAGTQVIDKDRSIGRITVNPGRTTGWFDQPILWYRDHDTVLLAFQKEIVEPESKVPHDPANIVGGISTDDPRPFLRFDRSNRESLSREYVERKRAAHK